MVKLNYLKYAFMSNLRIYNILWLGLEVFFADNPWQKLNINQVAIY
jgi:hypothetical protein